MRDRTRIIAAAAAVTAAMAGSGAAALAAGTGAAHGAPAKAAAAASKKPGGSKMAGSKAAAERQGHDAMAAAVARELHVSAARVRAALRPIFAAGHADPSSPAFAAAARSLGVTTGQLSVALMHVKESMAASMPAGQRRAAKAVGARAAAAGRQAQDAMTAAVARQLHISLGRVSAALRPLFAAGHADSSSPLMAAAARALGVSTQQLSAALVHAKESMAAGS